MVKTIKEINYEKDFRTCIQIYFFSCFFALFTNYAYAYIDPSAVTYVIQAVAGVLIALGAAFTIFRHKIFAFFKKIKRGMIQKMM